MTQVNEHLQRLLGDAWTHRDYQCIPHFTQGDYTIEARYDQLFLRCFGYPISVRDLPQHSDIHGTHKALEALFAALPKYTGSPDDDVPFG